MGGHFSQEVEFRIAPYFFSFLGNASCRLLTMARNPLDVDKLGTEFRMKVYNNMPHSLEVDRCNVKEWEKLCGSPFLRRQVAIMRCGAVNAEEWHQKYGHDTYLTCEEMFFF